MLSSVLYAMLKLSKTSSPQKLFDYAYMSPPSMQPLQDSARGITRNLAFLYTLISTDCVQNNALSVTSVARAQNMVYCRFLNFYLHVYVKVAVLWCLMISLNKNVYYIEKYFNNINVFARRKPLTNYVKELSCYFILSSSILIF